MMATQKTGVLLINTGSPDAPEVRETRAYLRQFLSDPRVIDIAPLKRWLLLNCIILPFRPKHSAAAYRSIWTDKGSPLIVHSENFRDGIRKLLPDKIVEIAMAYGRPSIPEALESLVNQGAGRVIVAPMFPQYASATFGSVLEGVYAAAASRPNVIPLAALAPFYEELGFLDAWAAVAGPELDSFAPDHVLFSYHGLPERQVRKCDPTGSHCLQSEDCCDRYREANPNCYRAHCFATTRGIVERLGLKPGDYTLAFQSKLGRESWLPPATDETLIRLAKSGVKKIAVISPAFVADCIETIEELGVRGRESFLENGGVELHLVPSLNEHPAWVEGFAAILQAHATEAPDRAL